MAGLLSKERIIAPPSFNRWLVPPASIAIHLCIGSVYAWGIFNPALMRALGVVTPAAEDWLLTQTNRTFTIAIVFLGLSAAIAGKWLEDVGPRKVGTVAATCWGGGFLLGGLGIYLHELWLVYLGYGVIGGCALGIGYISPVSTLMKWFPDRPGMATGMAIMGFGGGALIASPLSVWLMGKFASASDVGVLYTFITLGCVYFVFMMVGSLIVRVPAAGWKPEGYVPPATASKLMTNNDVFVYQAVKTPQFWLIWIVLFCNTTAGIGVLGQASAMSQEMFPGHITAVAAAGLVGLMSLFNMGGRFSWASLSDFIGRKNTYFVYMTLGFALYVTVPYAGASGNVVLFVICFLVIVSMYGGGFSTVPAYLRDMFGTRYVGAIHGILLTAWSAAGIAGPVLINYIREYNVTHGVPKAQAYNTTMYIMAGLLVVGFLANLRVKAVDKRHHMKAETDADFARATPSRA